MELQFRKNGCRCLNRAVREVQNQELTQEIRLTDGMPDIGRVLSSWGQMIIRSKEWQSDTVMVTGGVMVWVLYAPENGTEPRCIDGWIPFQMRWNLPDPSREGPVRISPMIRFMDSRTVSARKFMVRVGAAVLAEAMYPEEVSVEEPEKLPEDVEVLRRTYPIRLPKEAGEKTFLVDEDLMVPGSGAQPEKLMSYSVQPEITDCRVTGSKLVFRGNANLHMVYRCQEGRIRTWDFEVPFSQYADLESSFGPDACGDIQLGITSLELDRNEDGQLRLKCGMVAQYLIDDRELIELIEDAYSPRRPVVVQSSELILPAVLEERKEPVNVRQMLAGQGGEVADVMFYPDFPRQSHTPEGIQLEIPGLFQILFYGEDGALQTANARWEGKVNLPSGEDSRIDAMVMPVGRPQTEGRSDGMELSAHLQLRTTASSDAGLPMVTGLDLGEMGEQDQNRPSLILCRCGGEGLWNLAKRSGSTVAAIRQANGIDEEFSGERMLLIPVS